MIRRRRPLSRAVAANVISIRLSSWSTGNSEIVGSAAEQGSDPEVAARACLVGQPVALGHGEGHPGAALRISASARLVSETWSPSQDRAGANLQRELGRVGTIASKIEWLLGRIDDLP